MKYLKAAIKPLILFVFFALMLTLMLYGYKRQLDEKLRQRANETLAESVLMHSRTLEAKLDGHYYVMEALASYLGSFDPPPIGPDVTHEVLRLMGRIVKTGDFATISATDAEGSAALSNGHLVYISSREYFARAMEGKRAVQRIDDSLLQNDSRIILAVPIKNDRGYVVGVVHASFLPDVFHDLLIADADASGTLTAVYSADGSFIAGDSRLQPETGCGVTELLSDLGMKQQDAAQISEAMCNSSGGEFSVSIGGEAYYGLYQPLSSSDWFMFSLIPEKIAHGNFDIVSGGVLFLTLELVALFSLLILLIVLFDAQKARQLEEEAELLRQSEEKYRLLEELSDSVLFEVDLVSGSLTVSPHFISVFGFEPRLCSIGDKAADELLELDDGQTLFELISPQMLASGSNTVDFKLITPSGERLWARAEALVMNDANGEPIRLLGKLQNTDEQTRELQSLKQKAELDSMTQLFNAETTRRRIGKEMAANPRGSGALFVMDLDNFKALNDTLGHAGGDAVLKAFAGVIRRTFRSTDITGRVGGDEFVAYMRDVSSRPKAVSKAMSVCASTRLIHVANGHEVQISCSVGIAIYPEDGADFHALYANADAALYKAKAQGKNRFALYEPE